MEPNCDATSAYEVYPFPPARLAVIDVLQMARQQDTVWGLFEWDVTEALQRIHAEQLNNGEKWSFTAYVIRCVAQAVADHPTVAAVRDGNRGTVAFHDVDVAAMIERDFGEYKHPTTHFILQANQKSFRAIHAELLAAREAKIDPLKLTESPRIPYFWVPRWLRRLILKQLNRRPFFRRKVLGTVGVTSVGVLMPRGRRAFAIPLSPWTLTVAIGPIYQTPRVVAGQIVARDVVSLTLCFDHDLVDGSVAARFSARLCELIEGGYDLPPAVNALSNSQNLVLPCV